MAGEEIVEVQVSGKTPIHVANLTNRLKESLDVRFKNGQYVTMKGADRVFKQADDLFDQADEMFEQAKNLYKKRREY